MDDDDITLHHIETELPNESNPGESKDAGVTNRMLPNGQENLIVGNKAQEGDASHKHDQLVYLVDDRPAWHLTGLFALQQVTVSISGALTVPIIIADLICGEDSKDARLQIVSAFLVTVGVATILQCLLGVRLPVFQGACGAFILPISASMNLDRMRCPTNSNSTLYNESLYVPGLSQDSMNDTLQVTAGPLHMDVHGQEIWKSRLREFQGSIMLASLGEALLGLTGLTGLLQRYISPLTTMPVITLSGLALFEISAKLCEPSWAISSLTVMLILLFALYMGHLQPALPSYSKQHGCTTSKFPLFKLLPVVFAVLIAWMVSGIFTAAGIFSSDPVATGYKARTDARKDALFDAPWVFVPYPGQYGMPVFSVSCFVGMFATALSSVIKAMGDYNACAQVCHVGKPPHHAVNRGIAVEGIAGILGGAIGGICSTNSYGQNISAIGITKVASRSVMVTAGFLCLLAGVFGKFGAILTIIPDPVLGGLSVVGFGAMSAVGIANLRHVNMASNRNQMIIGIALIVGMMVPGWLKDNAHSINTGNAELDQTLLVVLGTPVVLGGAIGFILDNTLPGKEPLKQIPGPREMKSHISDGGVMTPEHVYDLPFREWFNRKRAWTRYLPVSHTYTPMSCSPRCNNTDNAPSTDNYT